MSDPINEIRPGQPMTDKQKEEMAHANAKSTAEAHKLAADHRARDAQNEPPLVNVLADSIKKKLEDLPPENESNPQGATPQA